MKFETNVFVNCPFDEKYLPLLRPLLFCLLYLGFEPRIALERLDSGEARVEKIKQLVRESKFGIHDLSRLEAAKVGELYRLNMPFELGLDVGCRSYGSKKYQDKRCLVLEAKPYRYQAALSDLAGSDIAVHHNEPVEVVTEVRNWLNSQLGLRADGPAEIWNRFNEFTADSFDALTARGFSKQNIEGLPIGELIESMKEWFAKRRA